MPFGLNIAPQVFQRWMDSIFNDLKDFCVVYIDDVLIFFLKPEKSIRNISKFFAINSKNMELYYHPRKLI
jgi:hypothetical protein